MRYETGHRHSCGTHRQKNEVELDPQLHDTSLASPRADALKCVWLFELNFRGRLHPAKRLTRHRQPLEKGQSFRPCGKMLTQAPAKVFESGGAPRFPVNNDLRDRTKVARQISA